MPLVQVPHPRLKDGVHRYTHSLFPDLASQQENTLKQLDAIRVKKLEVRG
jgi:hypothetical protein